MIINNERVMAWVAKVSEIKPIENADQIVAYRVNGWWVVDKINQYKVGDHVVYVSIDSWVPHEIAPFLSKGSEPKEYNGVKGNRVRTIKLRGQVSQGLLLPIDEVQLDVLTVLSDTNDVFDANVTEILNIQKWEPEIPAQLAGEVRGAFPSQIPKTDQERCQNLVEELAEWGDLSFEVTEKLDGSSCTMFLDQEGEFHVCSRNLDLKPSDTNSFWRAAVKYDVETKLKTAVRKGFAIQGELVGPVQGNPYQLKDVDFFVFDVYDVAIGNYLSSEERIRFCEQFGLKHVPVLTDSVVFKMDVDTLLMVAEGKSVLNPKAEREGLVFKCMTNPQIHFKAISNRFLLKGGN